MKILAEDFTIGNLLLTSLLLFVVGFVIKYFWKRRRIYYYSTKIEGPFGLPFVGTIHPFIKGKDGKKLDVFFGRKISNNFVYSVFYENNGIG
jgi:hypothetical protein